MAASPHAASAEPRACDSSSMPRGSGPTNSSSTEASVAPWARISSATPAWMIASRSACGWRGVVLMTPEATARRREPDVSTTPKPVDAMPGSSPRMTTQAV